MDINNSMDNFIRIPDYFKNKNIFITGGTGFIGKVLIEKLLRSCPDLAAIYILIRQKKGKSPEERIKTITELPLFDHLNKEHPENVKKILPVIGDVTEIGLGLSLESKQLLINNINIIFHCAASVRFDEHLRDAVILNTRGTKEVFHLAKEMKHLDALIHVSTTYCHTDKKIIDEVLYPALANWRDIITLVEQADSNLLDILSSKIIYPMPNTYTFSKGLAEHVVNDLSKEYNIPSVIIRPSIVISSHDEPVSGWIDNFNGPVGIMIACGKGILRTVYTSPDITADYVPVDITAKGLIIAGWKKAIEKEEDRKKISIYNASNNNVNNITIKQLVTFGKRMCWDNPLNNILWYPSGSVVSCYYYYYINVILYHVLPAFFIDGLLKILGQKPILFKIQKKIYIAITALQFYLTQEWQFINNKCAHLDIELVPSDRKDFAFLHQKDADAYEYLTNALLGAREFLLKENKSTMTRAKIHSRCMYVLFVISNTIWYAVAGYLILFKWRIFQQIGNVLVHYFETL